MRVDLHGGNAVPENSVQTNSPARAHGSTAEESSGEASRFSSDGAGVTTLASIALHAPEVRKAKVEALRDQIATGNYEVSPHQVAASILDQLPTRSQSGS